LLWRAADEAETGGNGLYPINFSANGGAERASPYRGGFTIGVVMVCVVMPRAEPDTALPNPGPGVPELIVLSTLDAGEWELLDIGGWLVTCDCAFESPVDLLPANAGATNTDATTADAISLYTIFIFPIPLLGSQHHQKWSD
jgi:hypothetical protein